MKRLTLCIMATATLAQMASAQVVREVISFLNETGEELIVYEGLRSHWSSYNLHYGKGETIDDYLYFFPNAYSWDRSGDEHDIIRLNQGDYSYIEEQEIASNLTQADDGVFTYRSAPGGDETNPYYGYWNSPADFDKFVYSWVLPDNIEVVDMASNRQGEWVVRPDAVAWFGENVNNVAFTISYRFKSAGVLDDMRTSIGDVDGVSLDQESDGVRVTLANSVLFASGSAELTPEGLALVAGVADGVDFTSGTRVIVEGHTDNVPIEGSLRQTFDSNWELSAARALSVVKAMSASGAPDEKLEARAFGEHQPIADNGTADGRAANRRISILISN